MKSLCLASSSTGMSSNSRDDCLMGFGGVESTTSSPRVLRSSTFGLSSFSTPVSLLDDTSSRGRLSTGGLSLRGEGIKIAKQKEKHTQRQGKTAAGHPDVEDSLPSSPSVLELHLYLDSPPFSLYCHVTYTSLIYSYMTTNCVHGHQAWSLPSTDNGLQQRYGTSNAGKTQREGRGSSSDLLLALDLFLPVALLGVSYQHGQACLLV